MTNAIDQADQAAFLPALNRYGDFFVTITPQSLARLPDLVDADIKFKDPFNDMRGIDPFRRMFEHMFKTIEAPRFAILHSAAFGQAGYLKWRFDGALRGRPFSVVGISEVTFDAAGKVAAHTDHWDAASNFYEKIPVLGAVLRLIKRRMRVKQ